MGKLYTLIDATRAAIRDPEDTTQVFRIAEVLSLGTPRRLTRRFRRQRAGLLADKPDLLGRLTDRAYLESLPPGSLGRAYLEFIDSEGITAEGLIAASEEGSTVVDPDGGDVTWVKKRVRDSHDLWHAVIGYHGDLLGETALLAFTFAQTRHFGVGFLAAIGYALAFIPGRGHLVVNADNEHPPSGPEERRFARQFIVDGYRRGRRARWFVDQPWEELLPLPLETVRDRLGVDPVPAYETIRPAPRASA